MYIYIYIYICIYLFIYLFIYTDTIKVFYTVGKGFPSVVEDFQSFTVLGLGV